MSSIPSTVWSLEPHTKAKHEILENYLKAWFPILSKNSGRLVYLDGFAGPGIYEGDEFGSPIIAMKTVIEHSLRDRFKEIVFAFIEKDKIRAAKLKEVISDNFPELPENLDYEVICKEFKSVLEEILDRLESKNASLAPTFAFIDPFGYSGLPLKLIARMMQHKKCEVLITFMVGFINRFTADKSKEPALNDLFGTDEWKKVRDLTDPEKRRRFLLDLYKTQLMSVGGIKYVRSFEMVNSKNQPIYYLVYGTKHQLGLEVIKEAMWKVDDRGLYRFSDLTDVNQKYLVSYQTEQWIPKGAELVYEQFKGKTVSKSKVKKFVITETPYRYRKPILEHLEKEYNPPKICNVVGRKRIYSYPDRCVITFSE